MQQVNEQDDLKKQYEKRLLSSAERLRARLYEKYDTEGRMVSSVNNSLPVTFTSEMRAEQGIYPYGRREINGLHSVLWASPEAVDRTAKYVPQNHPSIDQMERTRAGVAATWEWRELELSLPVKPKDTTRQFSYEKALLTEIAHTQGRVYLHNPSNATVWAAEKLDFRIICDQQWQSMYTETLAQMQVRGNVFSRIPDDSIVYMGPHGKKPDTYVPYWCALAPNVYAQAETGRPHKFSVEPDGVHFEYVRREHVTKGVLLFAPDCTRYNPASVDVFLHQTQSQFFLEANFHIDIKDREEFSSPLLWIVEPLEGNENDTIVWDVPGPGTYMSRRRLVEERARVAGKRPCTLSMDGGSVAVSLTTYQVGTQRFFTFEGNPSQLRILTWDEPQDPVPVIFVHESPDRGEPLMLVPGLFFSVGQWGARNNAIEWRQGRFFVLKNIKAAHSMQIDLVRFFFGDSWSHHVSISGIVKTNPMPSVKDAHIDLIVDDIMNQIPAREIPHQTLHVISKRTYLTSRYLYHSLSRFESLALVNPLPSNLMEQYLKDSVDNPESLRVIRRDRHFSSLVPVHYIPWMKYHGFSEEAQAIWAIRQSTGRVKLNIPRLPFVIWFLDLPIQVHGKGKDLSYRVMDSPSQRALDSVAAY